MTVRDAEAVVAGVTSGRGPKGPTTLTGNSLISREPRSTTGSPCFVLVLLSPVAADRPG